MANNKPAKKIRNGNVQVSIWRNETKNGVMYTVSISRSYRDSEGNWKSTPTISQNDLGNVMMAIIAATTWIQSMLQQERNPQPL